MSIRVKIGVSGPECDFVEALRCFKTAEHGQALVLARRAARNGYARAQYFLSLLYEHGFSRGLSCEVQRKQEERWAAYWRQKASEAGYEKPAVITPMCSLDDDLFCQANCYTEMENPEQDDCEAATLYQQAVDGNPKKAAEKNFYYFEWINFNSDVEKRRWLTRLARKGNKFAQCELAILERKSSKRRVKLLQQAAEQGNRTAQYYLGLAYCGGDGVKQDYVEAVCWLQKAAVNLEENPHFDNEPGQPQSDLGHLYREGKGVMCEPALAVHWYEKALSDINCGAALALAMAYECGYGVEQNLVKAENLYKRRDGNIRQGANDLAEFFLDCMINA